MLKTGVKSRAVAKLQMQLRRLDMYSGIIDAVFGNETDQSVRIFQKTYGLQIDGIAGPYTISRLTNETKNAWLVLFLHCAATPEGRDVPGKNVKLWHTLPTNKGGRGWSRPGYSDVVELDGTLVNLRTWDQDDFISDWEYTFGVKHNTLLNYGARHVCYIGGMSADMKTVEDTRTDAQKYALEMYVRWSILRNPRVIVAGHNQVQQKGCPSFDVPQWCRSIGIPEHNICNWGRLYV